MITLPFLAVGFLMKLVAGAFIFCSVVLVLTVLLQKGRGGGLGTAFGGGAGGGLLGSKTGDFLTWVTIFLVGIFLVLAVVMAKYYKPTVSEYGESPGATGGQPTGTIPLEEDTTPAEPEESGTPVLPEGEGMPTGPTEEVDFPLGEEVPATGETE